MKEIEELKKALAASPENAYLRLMLLRKMQPFPSYDDQMEPIIQDGLKSGANTVALKELLAGLYFRQGKRSACLVLADEIGHLNGISSESRALFAKCYLEEGDRTRAQEIYQQIVLANPSFSDDVLDEAFRMKTNVPNDEELDSLFSRPDTTFADVGGMELVKREIDLKIIKPLENAELYASYGKKWCGILLYGPPGCGKTFIAKATAGEINANFINITLNDILDMWIGNSEKISIATLKWQGKILLALCSLMKLMRSVRNVRT